MTCFHQLDTVASNRINNKPDYPTKLIEFQSLDMK